MATRSHHVEADATRQPEAPVISPLLRRPEVERQTGLSSASIYRLMQANLFPRPRRIGIRAVAWFQSEIEDWKNTRPTTDT